MTDRLDIFERPVGYVVAWDDEGYPGLCLGEKCSDEEHAAATQAASVFRVDGTPKADTPMLFESHAVATKALRAARAAVRAHRAGKPWPEWATTAKANGWTPPKGWKP